MNDIGYIRLTNQKHLNRVARIDMSVLETKLGLHHALYKDGQWNPINLNEYFFPFGDYNDEYEDITETEAKELMNFWDKEDKVNV